KRSKAPSPLRSAGALHLILPDQTRLSNLLPAPAEYSQAANSLRRAPYDSCRPTPSQFPVPSAQIEYPFVRLWQASPAVPESLPASRAIPGPARSIHWRLTLPQTLRRLPARLHIHHPVADSERTALRASRD